MNELLNIKGIGNKSVLLLNKLGIYSYSDLIHHYPFRYEILQKMDLLNCNDGDSVTVEGVVESKPSVFRFRGKMNKMTFRVSTNNLNITVSIFNRAFLKPHLDINKKVIIIGKWNQKKNLIIASNIRFDELSDEVKIEPVYHTVNGISTRILANYIQGALTSNLIEETLPEYLIEKYNFLSKDDSVRIIHNPKEESNVKKAQDRLKYEELFMFMLKVNYLKLRNEKESNGLSRNIDDLKIKEYINKLPFELTIDQNKVIKEINKDLNSKRRMNRLLQGDVGSGKTVVSVVSMYANYLSGYQSALMVPTEILANQHFNSISKLLKGTGIKLELLTGSLKKREKENIYSKLLDGDIDVLIGTHALIQDNVEYKNLGLVITDEQHRFGVDQRSSLKNKGVIPDVLYMSATPIPRTYALTIYGDMDISIIKSMPLGRKDIITYVKRPKEIKEVLVNILDEVKQGHQIYVIAPLIEESEKMNLKNVTELEKKFQLAFKNKIKTDILHGRMKKEEKENIMKKFSNKEIHILISTTVIEVGVDMPNATMMIIFDADRFGLSTLHQLRGRVGRSELQSYCYLISEKDRERLTVMTKTNDGFEISEADFNIRGEGDLFGIRQSGDMVFKIANLKNDFEILLKAKADSMEYLKKYKENIRNNFKKELQKIDNLG